MDASWVRSSAIDESLARRALTPDQSEIAAILFKALSEPVRVRLMSLIASHRDGEASVSELAEFFDVTQSNISHHLRALREAGLVIARKRPPWTFYRADPRTLTFLSHLLDPAVEASLAPAEAAIAPQ
jgi:ArsR family transcriptional regulator